MNISINDLKGFDFSNKYLNIDENFYIRIDGKQVNFNIVENEYGTDDEYMLKYEYYDKFRLVKSSSFLKNPFDIFREVEKNIVKSESILDNKSFLIKHILKDFNPNFNDWTELSKKLSEDVNLLKLFPNYKSSKIPQNLSKKDLAKYLDKFTKYELETLFNEFSILDFEIFYQNTWGEDYEYLIKKAFSINILEEKFLDWSIFRIINEKRSNFYIATILKNNNFDVDKYDSMVPAISSIIHFETNGRVLNNLKLDKFIKDNNIDLNNYRGDDLLDKIKELKNKCYSNYNNEGYYYDKSYFNNLDDCMVKSKYVFVLKAISSSSKSPIVMRYKIPKEDRDEDSVQTIALNNGHIKYGNSKDVLSEFTKSQLSSVLKNHGLKVSGNKNQLIERIINNLSDEIINEEFPKKYFILTEKGKQYLEKYSYLAEFRCVIPPNFSLEEFDEICNLNLNFSPDDIIKCLVNEKWLIWNFPLCDEPESFKEVERKKNLEKIFKNRNRDDNYFINPGTIILV